MLGSAGQQSLCSPGRPLGPDVELDVRKAAKIAGERLVISASAGGVEQLQRHGRAERQLVALDELGPAIGDLTRSVPGARVSEVRRHLRRPEPSELFRPGTETPVTPDSVHDATTSLEPYDLVERSVDRVGDRLGAEDLARLRELLAVDGH